MGHEGRRSAAGVLSSRTRERRVARIAGTGAGPGDLPGACVVLGITMAGGAVGQGAGEGTAP